MTAPRSFRVFIHEWDVYSTVLEAESEVAAIAQAESLFDAEGPDAFKHWNNGRDDSWAEALETDVQPRAARIRALNDALRQRIPFQPAEPDRVVMTAGVAQLDQLTQLAVMVRVREFTDFTPDNDPHGEHDFGSFALCGARYFWKIDYYDLAREAHSPDATDPAVTSRVLTVMLASEY